jgi:hypothetical protein
MISNTSDKKCIVGLTQDSQCMDCVFWYQCRQGNVDCNVKASLTARKAVGA